MSLQIEYLKREVLKDYHRNSRTHSEDQVNQIAKSITEFGWTNPVLIDKENTIIAGHGRVMAAEQLGIVDIPCIRLENLSDAQKRAYVIADNKLAENAGWDNELLKLELHALSEINFDLEVIGFEPAELSTIMFDDPVGESSYDGSNFIVQYNIIFDDEEQQDKWFQFLRYLKDKYPNKETIGERLSTYIEDHHA
jgi:hypothetical protein